MRVCKICKRDVSKTFTCKHCGAYFCNECGDTVRYLCDDCLDYIEAKGAEGEVSSD